MTPLTIVEEEVFCIHITVVDTNTDNNACCSEDRDASSKEPRRRHVVAYRRE